MNAEAIYFKGLFVLYTLRQMISCSTHLRIYIAIQEKSKSGKIGSTCTNGQVCLIILLQKADGRLFYAKDLL